MTSSEQEFFEDLTISGQTCPPDTALAPDGKTVYYRIVKTSPASSDCFISHRSKFPDREFHDECEARSISLSTDVQSLVNAFFKMPAGKKRKEKLVGKVVLQEGDGIIQQTGADYHHSWWRSKTFDPITVMIQKIEV